MEALIKRLATIKVSEAAKVNTALTAQGIGWGIYVKPPTGGGDGDHDADDGVGGIQDDSTHPDG